MDTDERLRRRRERYRSRRTPETPQQNDERRARRREYDRVRRTALSHEERCAINDARRTRRQATTIPPLVNQLNWGTVKNSIFILSSFPLKKEKLEDHRKTDKIKEFYTKLYTIEPHECSICKERFLTIRSDRNGICVRCQADTKIPRLYSAENNMDPGQLPPQITVSS